ncbi:hypothetical protein BC833DRAFT_625187 [Globomyces pollinis-pini]|nr:hypothetical protein BC833DRAFT_625187 [Globomyces pollinis-pini]
MVIKASGGGGLYSLQRIEDIDTNSVIEAYESVEEFSPMESHHEEWESPILWNAFDTQRLNGLVFFDGTIIDYNKLRNIIVLVFWTIEQNTREFWESLQNIRSTMGLMGTIIAINMNPKLTKFHLFDKTAGFDTQGILFTMLDKELYSLYLESEYERFPCSVISGSLDSVIYVGNPMNNKCIKQLTEELNYFSKTPCVHRNWKSPLLGTKFDFTIFDQVQKVGDFPDLKVNEFPKVLLIDFWASWCTPCLLFMSKLCEFKKRIRSRAKIFSIHLDFYTNPNHTTSATDVQKVLDGLKLPQAEIIRLLDTNSKFTEFFHSIDYGLIPCSVVIEDGVIVYAGRSGVEMLDLVEQLTMKESNRKSVIVDTIKTVTKKDGKVYTVIKKITTTRTFK